MPLDRKPAPDDLRAFRMPFTASRQFRSAPRRPVTARDMHAPDADALQILDGTAGLWCSNAGHSRLRVTGDIIAMSSPPIISKAQIEPVGALADVLKKAA